MQKHSTKRGMLAYPSPSFTFPCLSPPARYPSYVDHRVLFLPAEDKERSLLSRYYVPVLVTREWWNKDKRIASDIEIDLLPYTAPIKPSRRETPKRLDGSKKSSSSSMIYQTNSLFHHPGQHFESVSRMSEQKLTLPGKKRRIFFPQK